MEYQEVKPWKKLKVLGSGGFGQVTLWYNSDTGQKMAIKKLQDHNLKDADVRVKQTERWCKEVEIMKKLNHVNIVSTLDVPPDLNDTSSLPLLGMEYCPDGDLRRVLNRPENCNGLSETEILDILKDVSNGLAYLHSCKIIHRDLKPDNIVLVQKELRMVYKLIDLGYAKAFDQNSLSQSFVGTIQYIAPELFLGKTYTSSVDYWSFGLLAHEIITGYRPFLPGYNPSDWMRHIQNKARNVISVLENEDTDITFSSYIPKRNRLSRCFIKDMENWLQLALDWNGQTRGRNIDENRVVIFEELGNISCKKVIKVFSIPTYEILDFEITWESNILDLRKWIKKQTALEEDDQVLLLPSGKTLNKGGNLLNIIKTERLTRNDISIYLYNYGSTNGISALKAKPNFSVELLEKSKIILKYRNHKRRLAESICFLQSQALLYRLLLQGIRAKIDNIKQKTAAIESLYEDVSEEWTQSDSYCQFLSFSHKIDLENYIQFRKNGKLKTSPSVKNWIRNVTEIDKKITELKKSYNKNDQKQLLVLARQRCQNLENLLGTKALQGNSLDDVVVEGYKIWENIQKYSKESFLADATIKNLFCKSVERSSELLNDLTILFSKIYEADKSLAEFLTHLTALHKSLKILKLVIENIQRERQKNVWNLIMEDNSETKNIDKNDYRNDTVKEVRLDTYGVPLPNGKHDEDGMNENHSHKPLKKADALQPCKNVHFEKVNSSLPNLPEASLIINVNNDLRYQMQDVQQNCDQLVKEIQSLNWDFISDVKV